MHPLRNLRGHVSQKSDSLLVQQRKKELDTNKPEPTQGILFSLHLQLLLNLLSHLLQLLSTRVGNIMKMRQLLSLISWDNVNV